MINRFYKTIHNKYSSLFRFIFFLRYLFLIFFITIFLFLFIPKLFNYEKKASIFKNYLFKNYEFNISKYEKIEFKPFPLPKIEFKNVSIKVGKSPFELNVEKLQIYPKLFNIYNHENFDSNKIVLNDSNVSLQGLEFQFLINKLIRQKNKLYLNDLDLNMLNKNQFLITLENIKFANYGYKKNIVNGKIFGKKFKSEINDKLNNFSFEIINSGVKIDIDLNKKNQNFIEGVLKTKILNTKLKLDFMYNQKLLSIHNLFFRSKNLSLNNYSKIILDPFLDIYSEFEIQDINFKIFEKLQINKLLSFKNFLKQINARNEINYSPKKFSQNSVNNFLIKLDLAYGRLNFFKKLSAKDNFFQCDGTMNLLEESPVIFFDCLIKSSNKYSFLKKFNINIKKDNKIFNLTTKGNLGILNNKINFKNIEVNKNYKASNEDLKFFKETFEKILFDDGLIKIFNRKKIKKFILEIS